MFRTHFQQSLIWNNQNITRDMPFPVESRAGIRGSFAGNFAWFPPKLHHCQTSPLSDSTVLATASCISSPLAASHYNKYQYTMELCSYACLKEMYDNLHEGDEPTQVGRLVRS